MALSRIDQSKTNFWQFNSNKNQTKLLQLARQRSQDMRTITFYNCHKTKKLENLQILNISLLICTKTTIIKCFWISKEWDNNKMYTSVKTSSLRKTLKAFSKKEKAQVETRYSQVLVLQLVKIFIILKIITKLMQFHQVLVTKSKHCNIIKN
jgi:hypothetical protein